MNDDYEKMKQSEKNRIETSNKIRKKFEEEKDILEITYDFNIKQMRIDLDLILDKFENSITFRDVAEYVVERNILYGKHSEEFEFLFNLLLKESNQNHYTLEDENKFLKQMQFIKRHRVI